MQHFQAQKNFAQIRNPRGEIFLELLMVFPFLILLAMVAFEFSMSLRAHQYLLGMVRESAKEAFRECAALGLANICNGGSAATDICLGEIRARQVTVAVTAGRVVLGTLQNYDIVLSSYRWSGDSSTGSWIRAGLAESASCATNSTCTKVTAASLNAEIAADGAGTLRPLMAEKNMLIVGEIYANYNSPLSGSLGSLSSLGMPGNWVSGQYYERIMF